MSTSASPEPSASYPVASTVVTAAEILEFIGDRGRAVPQEISNALKLNRATVHRTLYTLETLNYISRAPDGSCGLTFHLFELGTSVLHSHNLVDPARISLIQLSEETGYTVNHGVLYDDRVLYIDKSSPPSYLQLDKTVGETDPLHCTSLGKSLLAFLTEDELSAVLDRIDLSPRTPKTITDRERLCADLSRTRERGYSIDDQEVALELRCIGAPVFSSDGTVKSALSVSGPADQITPERIPDIAVRLVKTAGEISERLRKHVAG